MLISKLINLVVIIIVNSISSNAPSIDTLNINTVTNEVAINSYTSNLKKLKNNSINNKQSIYINNYTFQLKDKIYTIDSNNNLVLINLSNYTSTISKDYNTNFLFGDHNTIYTSSNFIDNNILLINNTKSIKINYFFNHGLTINNKTYFFVNDKDDNHFLLFFDKTKNEFELVQKLINPINSESNPIAYQDTIFYTSNNNLIKIENNSEEIIKTKLSSPSILKVYDGNLYLSNYDYNTKINNDLILRLNIARNNLSYHRLSSSLIDYTFKNNQLNIISEDSVSTYNKEFKLTQIRLNPKNSKNIKLIK